MKKALRIASIGCAVPLLLFILSSFLPAPSGVLWRGMSFPYKQAGLTKAQAAAHLLSRFTFGASTEDVAIVEKQGLEKWFKQQLEAQLTDDSLQNRLKEYDGIQLSTEQILAVYPRNFQVVRMAIQDSVVNKDSIQSNGPKYRELIKNYMQQKGLRSENDLEQQLINQKILRAAYSQNQLQEVLSSFWFNHFNVTMNKGDCSQYMPSYERDVIRPNALGKFENLLLATAQSPAMLTYLDNSSSSGVKMSSNGKGVKRINGGLNENYAREVMELHTLGVDGGYTQQDVTEAARVLTGWTLFPLGQNNKEARERLDKMSPETFTQRGFVHTGDFLFASNRHDDSSKTVLGHTFKAGGGYEEGVALLHMLATNPSTAKFISRKLAIRFVSDNPPQSLIDKMAKTFTDKDGDIKAVLTTMVCSPEFWSKDAIREKTKSPFELVISAVRSIHADIKKPYQLFNWMNRMGEKTYYYVAPTGFPDRGQYWINTGSLLNRMNFGLALASGRIPGVTFNLLALNNNHEPESTESALNTFCHILMPERSSEATIKRLTPLLNDPELQKKVEKAAGKTAASDSTPTTSTADKTSILYAMQGNNAHNNTPAMNKYMLAQVVGIIIGSPEFQRR
ncbi:Uncharacterized conserved protein, DUF1800 family [Filimonas lacunae]|uniref:Uncharacterized conserved protein, DUF1800 family n=1 Tax=Filimonas lacunae TaxID=477680 RepID=A0A173MDN9_9BACT|nr:DUF1800 domain-containing protein [Filimonas lacunae]BAV05713.1 hypothetical protein FLA_1725 [Filimonas lacunae]SIT28818.1 Uncharacterized conserved protein, DUF1800 family [Filimonas lacunae]